MKTNKPGRAQGAPNRAQGALLLLLLALPLLAQGQTAATSAPAIVAIGEVTLVTGRAQVTAGGTLRNLSANAAIYEGETISVGPNSYANLKFSDGGRVLLRPDTEFAVESFRYSARPVAVVPAKGAAAAATVDPTSVSGNAFFRLVRGGFRAVSGLIGKKDQAAYKVTTPAATIGIRGTDFEVQSCAGDCPGQARAAAGIADVASTSLAGLELAQAGGAPGGGSGGGVIVATNEGSIVLKTSRGDTVVNVGQVALAMASGQTFMLQTVPDNLLIHATPAPADCD